MSSATIAEFGIAFGKSMRAYEDVPSINIDVNGVIENDRRVMWVNAAPHKRVNYKRDGIDPEGSFLSQREDPQLTRCIAGLANRCVRLSWAGTDEALFPLRPDIPENRIPVSIHDWTTGTAIDLGDYAARWGQRHIGRPVRLVSVSQEDPRYVEGDESLGQVGFSDGYAVTVGSIRGYEILNAALAAKGRPPMPYNRSRTTFLLDGVAVEDPTAMPEDYIETITATCTNGLAIVFRRRKACMRCPIPDTDQLTGERKPYFRNILGELGRIGKHRDSELYGDEEKPIFTQNFTVEVPEGTPAGTVFTILRGAEVEVEYTDETNWRPTRLAA